MNVWIICVAVVLLAVGAMADLDLGPLLGSDVRSPFDVITRISFNQIK